jgi:hypothetical protein
MIWNWNLSIVGVLDCHLKFPYLASRMRIVLGYSARFMSLLAQEGRPCVRHSNSRTVATMSFTGTDLDGLPEIDRTFHDICLLGMKKDMLFLACSKLELRKKVGSSVGLGVSVPYTRSLKQRAISSGEISRSSPCVQTIDPG